MNIPPFLPHRRSSGFSLIELIFTLVLLGILAGLAAPNMSGYIDRTEVDSALNQLAGDIAYTRMLAIESGAGAVLTIAADGTSYTAVTSDSPGGMRRVDLSRDYPGLRLVAMSDLSFPLALRFNSRGLLREPDNAGVVEARHGGLTGSLRILASGMAFREN